MDNAGAVKHEVLRKFILAVLDSIQLPEEAPPLPRAWRDRTGQEVGADDTDEFVVVFHVHPGGMVASAIVEPMSSRAHSIQGTVDLGVLGSKLV